MRWSALTANVYGSPKEYNISKRACQVILELIQRPLRQPVMRKEGAVTLAATCPVGRLRRSGGCLRFGAVEPSIL